ncbi:hypothetical protein KR093_009424 [Drosophila rubida]|uniref:Uncharacterized protein n=1 Tax=Drosophila rubida TaxID=30044 RepID=A0AAD4PSC4_9MUSC|nr:hypothetical protein KR093_009424 [Drosophila rubida]
MINLTYMVPMAISIFLHWFDMPIGEPNLASTTFIMITILWLNALKRESGIRVFGRRYKFVESILVFCILQLMLVFVWRPVTAMMLGWLPQRDMEFRKVCLTYSQLIIEYVIIMLYFTMNDLKALFNRGPYRNLC